MSTRNDHKCTYCGAQISWSPNSTHIICDYCGSKYDNSPNKANSPNTLDEDINNQMKLYKGSDQYRRMMAAQTEHLDRSRRSSGIDGCISGTVNFIIFIIVLYFVLIVS